MVETYNRVAVEVGGQTLMLRTQNDPEYVKALAKYVDEKIEAIAQKNPRLSTSQLALLAAINLADEIHSAVPASTRGTKKR
jgi:cell division protein ZapA